MKLSDVPTKGDKPFRFQISITPVFGHRSQPNIPDETRGTRATPFVAAEVDIHELIKHQSAGYTEGAISGGAIAHSIFRGNYRNIGNVLRCQLAVIDIDAKNWPVELIKSYFPSATEFVAKSKLGPYVAAILPSKSLDPSLNNTCVAHVLIPLERSLGSALHIQTVLDAITESVLQDFPHLHKDAVEESTGFKGCGIDSKAGKNLAGLWYGMRADQSPMYVNPTAFLPNEWIDKAIVNAPQPDARGSRGGVMRLRRPSQRVGRHSGDAGYSPESINITDQVMNELEWLFENVLEPPGVGTYNEWFCDIKQFCSTHRPYFDDLFFDLVDRDETGHRVKDQSAQQQLDAAGFTSAPSWKPLIRALNYCDEDWLLRFYEAHGYHSCITYKAPGQDVYRISFQRYQLALLTKTHRLRCVIPEDF